MRFTGLYLNYVKRLNASNIFLEILTVTISLLSEREFSNAGIPRSLRHAVLFTEQRLKIKQFKDTRHFYNCSS